MEMMKVIEKPDSIDELADKTCTMFDETNEYDAQRLHTIFRGMTTNGMTKRTKLAMSMVRREEK